MFGRTPLLTYYYINRKDPPENTEITSDSLDLSKCHMENSMFFKLVSFPVINRHISK